MTIKSIDSETLKKWLENNEVIVVDVREPAEHAAQKIEGAKLVPLGTVCKKLLPDFSGKKLVIHCGSGGRSRKACEKLLAEDGNLEIYNLEGGIKGWSNEGNETKSSGKFFLPLDRQVQLTIGTAVFSGSVLGYFLNPLYFILPAFFGAGLIFAGLTGFCGLAIFLTKMPWNQKIEAGKMCLIKK